MGGGNLSTGGGGRVNGSYGSTGAGDGRGKPEEAGKDVLVEALGVDGDGALPT